MLQGIERRKCQLENAIQSQKEFVELYSGEFRQRGWIIQSRSTQFGQEFFLDYGFKNGLYFISIYFI